MSRLASAVLSGLLLLNAACEVGTSSTSREEARRLVDELYAAWSQHEPRRVDSIFAEDATYEDVAADQIHQGRAEIKALLRATFASAPDFRVTMTSLAVAGDTAVTEWVVDGTQTGAFGELPATGREFQLRGASVIVLRDGRIASVTDYYDMATFLRQLGATFEPPAP